jgi:sugar phosphate isomerase/epimerase
MASPLSVQLYSVKDDLESDAHRTLDRLVDIGFRQVEPFGLGNDEIPASARVTASHILQKALSDRGLRVTTVHGSVPSDPATLCAEANAVGAQTVIVPNPRKVPGFDQQIYSSADRIDKFAEALNNLAARAQTHGLRLGYHNHEFEWAELDGQPGINRLWGLLRDDVAAQVDLYWAQVGGGDPRPYLDTVGNRIVSVHVKDGPAARGADQTPIGEGDIPVEALLAHVPAVDWVLEIDRTTMDRFDLLAMNFDRLSSLESA